MQSLSPIGIFDSGLGGLAILQHIFQLVPQYDYVYLADNARVPYGGRSHTVVTAYTQQAVDYLFRIGCPLVILACNSASSVALRSIQQNYLPIHYPTRKVLGVIIPTVEAALSGNPQTVGVMATRATIESNAFKKEMHKRGATIQIVQLATPLLVPIIEEGEQEWEGLPLILKKYLHPWITNPLDQVILGCTHYEQIKPVIRKVLPASTQIISQGCVVAPKLAHYLRKHPEIEQQISKGGNIEWLVTDVNSRYQEMANQCFHPQTKAEIPLKLITLPTLTYEKQK